MQDLMSREKTWISGKDNAAQNLIHLSEETSAPNRSGLYKLPVEPNAPSDILKQYFVRLLVTFDAVKTIKKHNFSTSEKIILKKIQNLLYKRERTWTNAYAIEQYLAYVCDELTLDVELNGRLIEYQNHFDAASYQHYKQEIDRANSDSITIEKKIETKRSILLRLINELQWFYTKREVIREYGLLTRMRTGIIFLFSFIIFSLSLVLCITQNYLDLTTEVLIIGTCAGLLGASFSMLTRLRSQLQQCSINDLKLLHRIGYITLRPIIGVGASLILFFMIQSGLLDGSMFPKLPLAETVNDVYRSYRDISLIIVWSFIAGFSEQFVPHMLKNTKSRAT